MTGACEVISEQTVRRSIATFAHPLVRYHGTHSRGFRSNPATG
jgi:hypothetical protein